MNMLGDKNVRFILCTMAPQRIVENMPAAAFGQISMLICLFK